MLKIFDNLFHKLNGAGVLFCNWKGHNTLQNHLNGEGDLDLFVPLRFKVEFEKIIESESFKRVISYQADHDFIEHYFGLDKATNKFVHIHVYFKIVTGEHISKNYILPLEQFILKNLDTSSILPKTNVGAQQVIFLIRYFLKIGSFYGLLQYRRELKKYSEEWDLIDDNYDLEGVLELNLSRRDLYIMRKVYKSSSFFKKFFLSQRLKGRLKNHKVRPHFLYQVFVLNNFFKRLINKFFIKKKKLFIPGVVIGICGLDGSGKSSLVSALNDDFSKYFSVKTLHIGRPPSTILTFLFNILISIYGFSKRKKLAFKETNLSEVTNEVSIVHAIRSVILAYDRKVATIKAEKFSKNGYLVICDRYVGLAEGKMDSPRVPFNQNRSWLYQFCHRAEQKIYKSIKPADLIYHLSVTVEIAIERNNKREKIGKETEYELRERFMINSDAVFLADTYHFIDASVSFNKVLTTVTTAIWHSKEWIDSRYIERRK